MPRPTYYIICFSTEIPMLFRGSIKWRINLETFRIDFFELIVEQRKILSSI